MGYQPNGTSETREPISSAADILRFFQKSFKKPEEVAIGMEVEKHGIHKSTYKPITYLENNGLRKIQEKLINELDWKIERQEGKCITSMSRGGTKLNLELGESMSELSGRTHPSIHDLARELRMHQHELSEMSRLYDVVWLGIGYQPFATKDEIRMLKIRRFEVVHTYMKRRSHGLQGERMKNASVQANIDYTSEEDMQKKCQILLRLAPFLSAMYANSPLKEGKTTGMASYRTHIIRQLDRRRYGIRKIFFNKRFGFEKWIDSCLHIPMISIFRDDRWIPIKNMTFGRFLKSGYEGIAPTMDDWILHSSFIYTDVRVRQYIELRVCDSLPPFLIPSMQAIVKAFVYHKDGERAIRDLTKDWSFHDFAGIYHDIAKRGMEAQKNGTKLLDYCKKILDIAKENLKSFAILNEKKEDESVHLEPIKEFVFVKEKSPGQWVSDNWDGDWKHNPEKLIEWSAFE